MSFFCCLLLGSFGFPATTQRVSLSYSGTEGNGHSFGPALSGDGRYVAFLSLATNLVPGGTNGRRQIFVRDREAGITILASVSSEGSEANQDCGEPRISRDGRFVAFSSLASNLVPNDTNNTWDVFVHDRLTRTTERVSVSSEGTQANLFCFQPSLSHDGRFVCFMSPASNLVPGDNNGVKDIFVRDRLTGVTERVSVSSRGDQANGQTTIGVMSSDGRYVAMISYASNLVAGDDNGYSDAFVRDRIAGTTIRVGAGNSWTREVGISDYGRVVAFESDANDLVPDDTNGYADIFVWDAATGKVERVSLSHTGAQLDGPSAKPAISADGRFVVFWSQATNAVDVDTNEVHDIFVRDRMWERTIRASVGSGGEEGTRAALAGTCSPDGMLVAFQSESPNLVPDDTNGVSDVFVRSLANRAAVVGSIDFGLPPGRTLPTQPVLRVGWSGWPYAFDERVLVLTPDGEFQTELPEGLMDLSVKPSHWLRRTLTVQIHEGGTSELVFALVNGDAVPDNVVDLLDLGAVLASFGGTGMADLDESGQVGIADLSIVMVSFGSTGDP